LIGAVDGIVDGVRILGWAQAPEDPDTPVDLDVILDDVIEGTVVADRMRPDLLRSRIGNGRHGFEFRLMAPLSDRPHVIEVRRAGRGSRLGGLRKVPRLRDLDTNLPPALVRQDVACQKLLPGFYSSHTEGDALLEHKILSDARDATGCFSAVHATVPPGSQNAATIRATAAGAKIGLVWRQVSTTPTCITLIVDGEHIEVPLTADQVGDVGSEPEIWRGMSFHLIQRAFGPGIHSVDIVLRSTKAADATSKLCVCGIIVEKPNG
jgi:hypothetical protein